MNDANIDDEVALIRGDVSMRTPSGKADATEVSDSIKVDGLTSSIPAGPQKKRPTSRRKHQKSSASGTDMQTSSATSPVSPQATQPKVDADDVLELPEFKKFSRLLETLFDMQDQQAFDDQGDIDGSSDCDLVQKLRIELSKLSHTNCLHLVPTSTLVRLLGILDAYLCNSKRGTWETTTNGAGGDVDQNVTISLECAIACCTIMGIKGASNQVVQEDVISHIIDLVRSCLNKIVYPQFDPDRNLSHEDTDKGKKVSASGTSKKRKSVSRRSSLTTPTKVPKYIRKVYNNACVLLDLLVVLLQKHRLPDAIVLHLSETCIAAFFKEGKVSELQLRMLTIARTIFSHYPDHRQFFLDDLLISLSKVSASRRGRSTYQVSGSGDIQIISALYLQLTHSLVGDDSSVQDLESDSVSEGPMGDIDVRATLLAKLNRDSDSVSRMFLQSIIERCAKKSDECDFKGILEDILKDLLSVVYKPEWPSAERSLYLLCHMLVSRSRRDTDSPLRVLALDALGSITAKLREEHLLVEKDRTADINQGLPQGDMDPDLSQVPEGAGRCSSTSQVPIAWQEVPCVLDSDRTAERYMAEPCGSPMESRAKTQQLQDMLLNFVDKLSEEDSSMILVRNYYIAQYVATEMQSLRDAEQAAEKSFQNDDVGAVSAKPKLSKREQRRLSAESNEMVSNCRLRCDKLITWMSSASGVLKTDATATEVSAALSSEPISASMAHRVSRFLGGERSLLTLFDNLLKHILAGLNDNDTRVRTRALKSLAAVVTVDCSVLVLDQVKRTVEARFLDKQISVREAAVDIVGRFVMLRPDLTEQYYNVFSVRLKDTGVSVRKRVVKVFRDICVQQPNFPKVQSICSALLHRVHDHQVKDLVMKCFQDIWFTAPTGGDLASTQGQCVIRQRVMCIIGVLSEDVQRVWNQKSFEELLRIYLKSKDPNSGEMCKHMVNSVVDILVSDGSEDADCASDKPASSKSMKVNNTRACLVALYVFCLVDPKLVAPHAEVLRPYLSTTGLQHHNVNDARMVHYHVANILFLVLPIMVHPSDSFLAYLEETCISLIMTTSAQSVIEASTKCLSASVALSGNDSIVTDLLEKFYNYLKKEEQHTNTLPFKERKSWLYRCLFSSGLLCRYFSFGEGESSGDHIDDTDKLRDDHIPHVVYMALSLFAQGFADVTGRLKALTGLGHMFLRYPQLMIRDEIRTLYQSVFTPAQNQNKELQVQVLTNLKMYLVYEEERMSSEKGEEEERDLTEIGGREDSGEIGVIVGVLNRSILTASLSSSTKLRQAAFDVLKLILRQGLVLPVSCVPYLIALSSDTQQNTREQAQQQLRRIDEQYHDFICQKAMDGVRAAFRFHKKFGDAVRGFTQSPQSDLRSAALSSTYALLRTKKASRRSFLLGMIKLFVSPEVSPGEQAFIAENLAYFPYETQEEPLFVIDRITDAAAIQGTHVQGVFKELLGYTSSTSTEDDDDDEEAVLHRIEDPAPAALLDVARRARGVSIMLVVKQYIQRSNGFTELRCEQYNPSHPLKDHDHKIHKRVGVPPLDLAIYRGDEDTRERIAMDYVHLRALILAGEFDEFHSEDDGMGVDDEACGNVDDGPTQASTKKRRDSNIQTPTNKRRSSSTSSAGRGSSSKRAAGAKPRRPSTGKKPSKKKKPKRRKRLSDTEDDDDDDSDYCPT
eukprot:m.482398 g.482398  ORF g.482398 m.482398 type:complete len:1676 (+) comp21722_c0_seq2:222-5249(+)